MLTRHIRESLQVTPGPFPNFWAGSGDEAKPNMRSDSVQSAVEVYMTKYSYTKRRVLSKNLCRLLNKASHLTAFYALYSSLHLPVTPAQLMRPGIGRNASCAVGDFA